MRSARPVINQLLNVRKWPNWDFAVHVASSLIGVPLVVRYGNSDYAQNVDMSKPGSDAAKN